VVSPAGFEPATY